MSKKQLLAVGLIALSLTASGILYAHIQEKNGEVNLTEEGFIQEDFKQTTNTEDLIGAAEASNPQGLAVRNALSALKNIELRKEQIKNQISALSEQLETIDVSTKEYAEILEAWLDEGK